MAEICYHDYIPDETPIKIIELHVKIEHLISLNGDILLITVIRCVIQLDILK